VVVQLEMGQTLDRRASELGSFDTSDRYWVHFPARYREFRQRVVPALAAAGVETLDGSELLRDAAGSREPLFLDAVHLSRNGYARIADVVVARITASSLHAPVTRLSEGLQ
jgi:hypothetical protein